MTEIKELILGMIVILIIAGGGVALADLFMRSVE